MVNGKVALCRTRSSPLTSISRCCARLSGGWFVFSLVACLGSIDSATVARLCSPTSSLLCRRLTSPSCASSASAPRLPDADLGQVSAQASLEISRFPHKELLYMPGSLTTPARPRTCDSARGRLAFRLRYRVGNREGGSFAAQWLAYTLPCRRFACLLAKTVARLGANVVRYSFIATDFHRLLLAGFTGAHLKTSVGRATASAATEAAGRVRVCGWRAA